jgi:hypothetical protein
MSKIREGETFLPVKQLRLGTGLTVALSRSLRKSYLVTVHDNTETFGASALRQTFCATRAAAEDEYAAACERLSAPEAAELESRLESTAAADERLALIDRLVRLEIADDAWLDDRREIDADVLRIATPEELDNVVKLGAADDPGFLAAWKTIEKRLPK